MKQFHNILFVSNGITKETEALQQAMGLAEHNATLIIQIICPPFYPNFDAYKSSYETFLIEKMHQTIGDAKKSLSLPKKNILIKVQVNWENTPDIWITQQVLRYSYDLVIKTAENNDSTPGFKALDMALLRKCPCAVFLHRPMNPDNILHIAVAIDPKYEDMYGHELALRLLKLSDALAKHYKARLSIISCWDFVIENYLRRSILTDISQAQIDEMVLRESQSSYSTLSALTHEAKLESEPIINHVRGQPSELIPTIIKEKRIDLLVMGTVARTGISGFIIGNTAENILQKINCSLCAIKPPDFVSPVSP